MDFASLMGAELSKARPKKDTKSSDEPTSNKAASKIIRRADVEAERKAAYLAEQKAQEEKRQAKAAAKRKREDEWAEEERASEEKRKKLAEESRQRREKEEQEAEKSRRRRIGLPETPPPREGRETGDNSDVEDDDDEINKLTEDEVRSRLRKLGQPAALFAETKAARRKRLRLHCGPVTQGPVTTSLRLVDEAACKIETLVLPSDKAGRKFLFRQLATYFMLVLTEYEEAMEKRRASVSDPELQEASSVRTAYNAMVQCRENIQPLFRKLEKGDLEDGLLRSIVEIVKAAQERRYVDANDIYLRLSIGKAAWPIGVTMVGIHERSSREKLQSGEKGHVMGDEATRKYLQSIKRCLTFAQVRWPPEDLLQLMG